MTNDVEQRTRDGLGVLAASVHCVTPPIDELSARGTRRARTRRIRTVIAGLLALSLSGGIATAVVLRRPPTREAFTSGTTVGGLRISVSEFKQSAPDPKHRNRSHLVSGLCLDVFGPQGAGPACFDYDAISKGPQARVFTNNSSTSNGSAHPFTVSFFIFELPNAGLSKATVTAPNQPDIALDYLVDNTRDLVFALVYSDLPRQGVLATVSTKGVHRSSLDIVRYHGAPVPS